MVAVGCAVGSAVGVLGTSVAVAVGLAGPPPEQAASVMPIIRIIAAAACHLVRLEVRFGAGVN